MAWRHSSGSSRGPVSQRRTDVALLVDPGRRLRRVPRRPLRESRAHAGERRRPGRGARTRARPDPRSGLGPSPGDASPRCAPGGRTTSRPPMPFPFHPLLVRPLERARPLRRDTVPSIPPRNVLYLGRRLRRTPAAGDRHRAARNPALGVTGAARPMRVATRRPSRTGRGGSRRRRGLGTPPTSSAEGLGEGPAAPWFRMMRTIHNSAPKASRARFAVDAESGPSTAVYTSVGT